MEAKSHPILALRDPLLMINLMPFPYSPTPRSLIALVLGFLSCTSLFALPNIQSDGRLGSWADFLQSIGYTFEKRNIYAAVYVDTDRLTAGVLVSFAGTRWQYLNSQRDELRQNVGRLVAQTGGPDIVVYDFTEIITSLPAEYFPKNLVIIGQRPAAIVCQGMIGSYEGSTIELEDMFLGMSLEITALNSCDPTNPFGSRWPGTSPGGAGTTVSFTDDKGVTETLTGTGGSGGYGGNGVFGQNQGPLGGQTAHGGSGGSASFSWGILQAGSPGGSGGGGSRDGSNSRGNPYSFPIGRGGPGGGAVLIKAEGSIAIANIVAHGSGGETGGGSGSGGHVILDTPGTIRMSGIDITGPNWGGGGVVEFRRAPQIIGGLLVESGFVDSSDMHLGVVGFPVGVDFPASGSVLPNVVYRTSNRPDSAAPNISISGARIRNVVEGSQWTDSGATATDNVDGSVAVTTLGAVNTAIPGAYEVTYVASDTAGNTASKKRYINVVPNQPASRDPQSGLPQLVAATLRPINPTTGAVDASLLPTFEFVMIEGQTYPSVTFLRRTRDFLPIGSYAKSRLDEYHRMKGNGIVYSFSTSEDLLWWERQYGPIFSDFTFITRSNTRNSLAAPSGFEFATYRHNSATGSFPPRFYRVAVTADPIN